MGVVAFVLVFSAFPLPAMAATSSQQALFSMTLIAPTSNPLRRQWAAIIANSYQSVGIAANLVFVSFGVLLNTLFACPNGCPPPTYANGGFDAAFIGFGGGTPLPDFGTQNVIVYRDTGPGDVPPIGSNYYFFDNATYNQLSNEYNTEFSPAARTPLIQQMTSILMQQEPDMVLFYPASVYAWAPGFTSWGTNAITATSANAGYQHWSAPKGSTSFTIAETGDIAAINQLPTSAQNSYYAAYLFYPVTAAGEELDPRCSCYLDGTVQSVTSSSDHLTWTVTEVPHNFQDGVPVTADDYLFSIMSSLRNDVGYVGEGTFQSILGLNTQFTFLNGTTDYVMNGTYSHGTAPAGFTPATTFKSSSANVWTFTQTNAYVFTDPVVTGVGSLAMHIYEQYPASGWSSGPLSGFTGSSGGLSTNRFTVTWNAQRFGGNGSYAWAYGPVGDGAYIYRGYDPVAQVGTEVKFPGYYNATGLQSMGQFNIQTVHVQYINSKDAASAALVNGQAQFLDSNYQFNAQDVASLKSSGETVIIAKDPSNGWQEMGLNLNNPVFGTGTATPLGQSDPAKAAFAARMVRTALSYLIPRQYIVNSLLQGLGSAGETQVCTCFTFAYAPGSAPDPYDPAAAQGFLAAAGYSTGVAPPSTGISLPAPPTISVGNATVTVPTFLLGNTFTSQGKFNVDPVLGAQSNGFAITLEQYTPSSTCPDTNSTCWTPVALGSTNAGGYFSISYAPAATGTFSYRVFMTGMPETTVVTDGLNSPSAVEALVPPQATLRPLNATDTQYTTPTSLQVGSLGDVVNSLASVISGLAASTSSGLTTLNTNTQSALSQLQSTSASKSDLTSLTNQVTTLSGQVSSLNSQIGTLTDVAYIALAVAIILGLAAIFLSRRKPGA